LPQERIVVLGFLKDQVPLTTRITARRRIQDIGPTLAYNLNGRMQQEAQRELAHCHTCNDYLEYAKQWLGGGSIQIVPEIESAITTMNAIRPRRGCEIGTDFGGTTFLLSRTVPTLKLLIGVDLYIKNRARLASLAPKNLKLELVNGSSYAPQTVERVRRILGGEKLDVLLIDGDHRYEGVREDFLAYREFVRDGGYILFHDIVPDYTTRFGRPSAAYSGGVPKLWEELSRLYPAQTFINNPEQDGMGIGLLTYSTSVRLPDSLR
jgi:cephalosporin hydroxylase